MRSSNVTRRSLLKRAGVGAAVVGTGAMVTAASAQAANSTVCIEAGGCVDCPAADFPCDDNHCCYCFLSTEGCCFCAEDYFCDAVHACHNSADCPPGWGCVYDCCGEGTRCAPPCGERVEGVNACHQSPFPTTAGATGAGRSIAAHAPAEAPSHGHGGHQ